MSPLGEGDDQQRIRALELAVVALQSGQREVRKDTDKNEKDIHDVRTSIRTLVISLLMASIAFLGAAASIIAAVQ